MTTPGALVMPPMIATAKPFRPRIRPMVAEAWITGAIRMPAARRARPQARTKGEHAIDVDAHQRGGVAIERDGLHGAADQRVALHEAEAEHHQRSRRPASGIPADRRRRRGSEMALATPGDGSARENPPNCMVTSASSMMPTAMVVSIQPIDVAVLANGRTAKRSSSMPNTQDAGDRREAPRREAAVPASTPMIGEHGAQHQRVAMREIHRLRGRPHDVEAERDQRIDAADRKPGQDILNGSLHDAPGRATDHEVPGDHRRPQGSTVDVAPPAGRAGRCSDYWLLP